MTSKLQSCVQANIFKLKHGGLVDTLTLSFISSWDLEKNHTLTLSLNISQIGIKEPWVQRIVPKTAWADVSSKVHLKMQTWNVHNFIIHRVYYHQQHVSYQFTKVKQNKIILDHVFLWKAVRSPNLGRETWVTPIWICKNEATVTCPAADLVLISFEVLPSK